MWLTIGKWCLTHWRVGVYGALAIAVAWLFLLVRGWHADSLALEATQDALRDEQQCVAGSSCAKRVAEAEVKAAERQRAIDSEVLSGYEKGLQAVSDYAAAHPAPSVRLCRPAGSPVVRVPGSPGPADGAAASGDVPLEVGADIGRQLFDLADAADREALKLRALQQWTGALAQPPK